ncbi:MAG: hypothetical protein GX893_03970 [Firmicutes bacterium]|nr:hypothetical protein [Bacillota bacterium]
MERNELEQLLSQLQEELEDIREERKIVLGQTGIHLPGSTVKKYEVEIKALEEKIEVIKKVLAAKE